MLTVPVVDYATPIALTVLDSIDRAALADLPTDPVTICSLTPSLVIQPGEAKQIGLPAERFEENQIRPASRLLRTLLAMSGASLTTPREPAERVVGTCRHFALVSCALLRYQGIPARVRCGFAGYFQPGQNVDHWVTEYRLDGEESWRRIDSEIMGKDVLPHPERLRPGEFLSGTEAWESYRRGEVDGSTFGVCGTENWGPAEIRGNAVKDLAALNKVEMLPWDEWGRMTEAYDGKTGPDYDALLDELSAACVADDAPAIARLYGRPELRVPDDMIR